MVILAERRIFMHWLAAGGRVDRRRRAMEHTLRLATVLHEKARRISVGCEIFGPAASFRDGEVQ
jgi:hypothetical protein